MWRRCQTQKLVLCAVVSEARIPRLQSWEVQLTHNLENVVYNELIYRGYELYVLNKAGKEIDFLAIKNGKEYLIQVAYSVAEASAYNRKFTLFEVKMQLQEH